MTKFLKTVDIFVKRDANHLEVAFWFVNNSMELVLDSTCFFVGNREALTSLRQMKQTRTEWCHHSGINYIRFFMSRFNPNSIPLQSRFMIPIQSQFNPGSILDDILIICLKHWKFCTLNIYVILLSFIHTGHALVLTCLVLISVFSFRFRNTLNIIVSTIVNHGKKQNI